MPEAETELWGGAQGRPGGPPAHLMSGSPLVTGNGQGAVTFRA